MLEMPLLLLGLWCNPVRWHYDNNFLIYSRSACFQGDNFLQIDKVKLVSPHATCAVTKVAQFGSKRWVASGDMAFAAWGNCGDGTTTWKQKVTFLENDAVKVLTDWVEYVPGYSGPGRTLIRW